MADTLQNGIAAILRADTELMALLPGRVWTRRISRNTNPDGTPPTPGSTPEAFDAAGRILRCASVLNSAADANLIGPPGTYYTFPEIWLRCLPHESEKRLLHAAAERIIALLDAGPVVEGLRGEGLVLGVVGRMMPDDDPELAPAVVDMVRVRADSMWGG